MSGSVNDPPPGRQTARALMTSASLPCGADVDFLLEQVADGHGDEWDEHQQVCVHCQAALREFTAIWSPVAELAAVPVPPPRGLTATVMSQIRTLVRDVWYTLEITEVGALRVATRIVAVLARESARRIPGVRVVLGRSSESAAAALAEKATFGHHHPHAAVGVLGRTAVIDLAVAVSYTDPVHEVARTIQRQVASVLRDQIGLQNVIVNVTVDDILDDDER